MAVATVVPAWFTYPGQSEKVKKRELSWTLTVFRVFSQINWLVFRQTVECGV